MTITTASGLRVAMTPDAVTFEARRWSLTVARDEFVAFAVKQEMRRSPNPLVYFQGHRFNRDEFLTLGQIADALYWCYECNDRGTYRDDDYETVCPHCDGWHVVVGTKVAEKLLEELTKGETKCQEPSSRSARPRNASA